MRHISYLIAIAALATIALSAEPAEAQVDTRACSPNAQAALNEAFVFIESHGEQLKNDFEIGSRRATRRRISRRFDRKIDEMRVSCAARVLCREKAPRIALHAFGMAGRKIRVCYDKMLAEEFRFCDLVEIVTHEFGHAIGIKKKRFGQHHKDQNDKVYQFGWYARDLCLAERSGTANYRLEA